MPSVILERPTIDGYAIDRNSAFNRPAYWYVRGADGFPTGPLTRDFDPQPAPSQTGRRSHWEGL
jgi:hypothetical protein